MKENNCRIVNDRAVCDKPDSSCRFYVAEKGECYYHVNDYCCNVAAIMNKYSDPPAQSM